MSHEGFEKKTTLQLSSPGRCHLSSSESRELSKSLSCLCPEENINKWYSRSPLDV